MRALAALIALLVVAPPAGATKLDLGVALEPATATIGDPIVATLTLRGAPDDPAKTPRFPDWSRGWGDAEVRDVTPPERVDTPAGPVWSQRLVLAAFTTGRIALPPVAVAIPSDPPQGAATPADLALEIRSVLPEDTGEPQPRPPAPPLPLPLAAAFWWTAAALALAALAAGWLVARRRREVTSAAAALSAWEELERGLAGIDRGDVAAGHAALSLALRRYLGRSFGMPAAQSSTSELARRLGERGLERDLVRRAVRLLREVDQIKFARAAATGEQLAGRVATARDVARDVEIHLHPPATEAAA